METEGRDTIKVWAILMQPIVWNRYACRHRQVRRINFRRSTASFDNILGFLMELRATDHGVTVLPLEGGFMSIDATGTLGMLAQWGMQTDHYTHNTQNKYVVFVFVYSNSNSNSNSYSNSYSYSYLPELQPRIREGSCC